MRDLVRLAAAVALVLVIGVGSLPVVEASPALPAWRQGTPWTTEQAVVTVGDETVVAEVADTGELRSRGLGYRDGLAPGTGMLFAFEGASTRSFWMRGMRFCLDIIWIEGGTIRGAAENACPEPGVPDVDLARYVSPEPVTYVLELPAGWLQEYGYGAGTPVTMVLPLGVPQG